MDKTNNTLMLMKTCSSCGQQKPLSAFLQLAGTPGTTYGNICSTCRKTITEKDVKPKDPDDISRSSSGNKIDAKRKVKDAVDKREQFKLAETEYFEEREKAEETETKKFEKFETVRKEEKQRQNFFEKRSFMDGANKSNATPPEKVFGGEEQRAKEEKLDFATGPFVDTGIAGKVKYTQSTVFRAFKDLHSGTTSLTSAQEKTQRAQQAKGTDDKADKKAVTDFVQENWSGPKRSRP